MLISDNTDINYNFTKSSQHSAFSKNEMGDDITEIHHGRGWRI